MSRTPKAMATIFPMRSRLAEEVVAERDQLAAKRPGSVGEGALRGGVLGFACWGFDAHRLVAEGGEVVRGGLHVQRADVPGQLEAVEQERAGRERHQFAGPLVEVHVRVQAAALLQRWL